MKIETFQEFNESLNEANNRIVWGESEYHLLNQETALDFANKYKGQNVDIFFTKDNNSIEAQVTKRMQNIVYHGKDSGKNINTKDVLYIYAGLENAFYTPENFKKLLNSVYKGTKSRVPAMSSSQIHINEEYERLTYDEFNKNADIETPSKVSKYSEQGVLKSSALITKLVRNWLANNSFTKEDWLHNNFNKLSYYVNLKTPVGNTIHNLNKKYGSFDMYLSYLIGYLKPEFKK